MGTGSSSQAGKPRSPLAAEPLVIAAGGHGGSFKSAPSRQSQAAQEEQRAAAAAGRISGADAGGDYCSISTSHHREPAAQAGEPDADLELLNQILEECDDEELLPLQPLPPSRSRLPPRFDSGDSRSCPPAPAGGSSAEELLLAGSTQGLENSNFSNQLPLKKPERQAKISYDYSEEELMATIEQEYCR